MVLFSATPCFSRNKDIHGEGAAPIDVRRLRSPSGEIEAWFVEDHSLPLITVRFAFEGGASQDPPGKEGLGSLMSSLLDEGAGERDTRAFKEAVESEAIRLSFHIDDDFLYGNLKMLTTARAQGVELMRQALKVPRFDPETIDRVRSQLIASLRYQEMNPGYSAQRSWRQRAFPGHPYARQPEGTVASVPTLTREDILQAHQKLLARDILKVVVIGDLSEAEAGELLDRLFLSLPAKADLMPVAEILSLPAGDYFVPFDVPQDVIRFGYYGVKRNDPDFIPAFVMNHILGGGVFSSWLYQDVRETHGLAYNVSTGLLPLKHVGLLIGEAATRTEYAQKTIDLIKENLHKMVTEGVSPNDLLEAKKYLTGSYALGFDSASKIATHLLALQLYNLPPEYLQERNQLIESVSLEDIQRVAARLLSETSPLIVRLGQGE